MFMQKIAYRVKVAARNCFYSRIVFAMATVLLLSFGTEFLSRFVEEVGKKFL